MASLGSGSSRVDRPGAEAPRIPCFSLVQCSLCPTVSTCLFQFSNALYEQLQGRSTRTVELHSMGTAARGERGAKMGKRSVQRSFCCPTHDDLFGIHAAKEGGRCRRATCSRWSLHLRKTILIVSLVVRKYHKIFINNIIQPVEYNLNLISSK